MNELKVYQWKEVCRCKKVYEQNKKRTNEKYTNENYTIKNYTNKKCTNEKYTNERYTNKIYTNQKNTNEKCTNGKYANEKYMVVERLLLLHNFIQLSLNSGSAQFQNLLTACWRVAMIKISDNGPGWK